MIEISGLYKKYGSTVATDIETLSIRAGERIGLVGNNGAGKTTLISLMLDLIKADRGSVNFEGEEVDKSEAWKNKIAAFLDDTFIIDYLTPDEYFKFIAKVRQISDADLHMRLNILEPIFKGQIIGEKKYIRDLSKGNKKKVGIAAALIAEPSLLYLDEPFANLDPSSQIVLQRMVNDLPSDMTLFISSHDLTHISQVCKRIIILENGKIVKDLETSTNTLLELKTYFAAKSDVNEI
jgi:ABC-2 type transport system ATP-binding protein